MGTSSYGPLAVTNNLVLDFFNSFSTMENLSISQTSTRIYIYLNISPGASLSVSIQLGEEAYVKNAISQTGLYMIENLPLCRVKFEDVVGTVTFRVTTKNA